MNIVKSFLAFWPTFLVWLPTTLLTLIFVSLYAGSLQPKGEVKGEAIVFAAEPSQKLFASYPKNYPETIFAYQTEDAIPQLVKDYLAKHKSPMVDQSDKLVSAARKNQLDPLLLVAIAQCESNLGKKMPADCYNPFGWGIHSAGKLCFSSWEEGFEKVAAGLKKQYIDKGLISPDEIMTKYNYDSWKEREGSWGKCVKSFLDDLQYNEE